MGLSLWLWQQPVVLAPLRLQLVPCASLRPGSLGLSLLAFEAEALGQRVSVVGMAAPSAWNARMTG